jgi:D-xylose transport system substrate-binding protein
MKKWLRAALCLVLGLALLLGACGSPDDAGEATEQQEGEKLRIGMSFDSFVIERWQRDRDVFVSTAKELGAEVNVQNANGDLEEQKKQIDYFIEKGMDAIVIVCIDSEGLKDSVEKAKAAGITVVAYDRLIKNADVDLYITFDNAKVGELMAQALLDMGLSGGSVLMLGGPLTDSNVPMVEDAFRAAMEENGVTILDSSHAKDWKAELAADYLYENPDIVAQADAIMCGNDNLASQVVPVLAEKQLAGKTLVVGQDADLEACQRIVEGTQLMTVYKPIEKLAQRAAACTVALIRGEKLGSEDVVSMTNGSYVIPYVGIEPTAVTADNMDEVIINSGFHLKEDVYLNVPSGMP